MKHLKRGCKLIFFGVGKTMNLVCMAIFLVVGILVEVWISMGLARGNLLSEIYAGFDFGLLLMICAAMFPGQLLTSVDASFLAQSSAHKKRLQCDTTCLLTFLGNLAAMTIVLGIRLTVAAKVPEGAEAVLGSLPMLAVDSFVLILYFSLIYKYFVASMVVLYVVLMAGGAIAGVSVAREAMFPSFTASTLPVPVMVLLCYGAIFVGGGVQLLLTRAVYKRPFSKYAFGSTVRKYM